MMSLSSLPRILSLEIRKCGFLLAAVPKFGVIPSANITSKEWRDPDIKKHAPWPYETKKFTFFHAYIEGTVKRFDENTKVIVVEGNMGAGKTEFAKQLAEAFDMRFVPEPDISELYILKPYGYNMRDLDSVVPPSYKSFFLEDFYKDPKSPLVPKMQMMQFLSRLENYIDAFAHLLNTGQGIVMDRCVYSDFIFLEAMFKAGCFRKEVKDFYYEVCQLTLDELIRPHLILYLDVTPEVAMERIKKRNSIEVNSPILTMEYLKSIEDLYKQRYLKEFQKHSEILVYDWNNYGDVEVVVEDIERIDFDRFTQYDTQLKDWRKADDWEWAYYRRRYTNQKNLIMNYAQIWKVRVHEMFHSADEVGEFKELMEKMPGMRYAPGYNPLAGDKVLLKGDLNYRESQKYRIYSGWE